MTSAVVESVWLLEVVKSLTGVDVERDLIAPLAGSWDRMSAYGEAMTTMARCVQSVSLDVSLLSADLGDGWRGEAADAAHLHLGTISASLRRDSQVLAQEAIRVRELAVAMRCGQNACEVMLKAVLDAAMEVAVWMAAGTTTSRTPVGSVIGYGMATYKTAYLVHLIAEWTRLVTLAWAEADRFAGDPARKG